MKYIFLACIIFLSCATAPLYRDLPKGNGFEILDPEYGKLIVFHSSFKTSNIDTIHVSQHCHAIFGDSSGTTFIRPPKEWRHIFGPVTGIVFFNLSPDTMSISLLSESKDLVHMAYKGPIQMGRYQLNFIIEDFAPDNLAIVRLSVGKETKYFKGQAHGFSRMIEIE